MHYWLGQSLGSNVFIDIDNLAPGVDWQDHIREALAECDVALVLIGKAWLSAADGEGRRRLDNPNDVLRLEVAEVLRRGTVRVIPVVVAPAPMPSAEDLPDDIRGLARRQAFKWYPDVNGVAQLQQLEKAINLGPFGARMEGSGDAGTLLGGLISARVFGLSAELLDEIGDPGARTAVEAIQRDLTRPRATGSHILPDASRAGHAFDALEELAWSDPALRFIAGRIDALRDSAPDMQLIELAKWHDRAMEGLIDLPETMRRDLRRVLTAPSAAAQAGLTAGASREQVSAAAADCVRAWRRFEGVEAPSPTAERVAGDLVRFYEGLALGAGVRA